MKNKQTAVEWLVEQLRQFAFDPNHHLGLGDIRLTQGQIDELQEQAKEMEKQQKINAYNQGYRDGEIDAHNPTNISKDISEFSNAENYYNETYGGNK